MGSVNGSIWRVWVTRRLLWNDCDLIDVHSSVSAGRLDGRRFYSLDEQDENLIFLSLSVSWAETSIGYIQADTKFSRVQISSSGWSPEAPSGWAVRIQRSSLSKAKKSSWTISTVSHAIRTGMKIPYLDDRDANIRMMSVQYWLWTRSYRGTHTPPALPLAEASSTQVTVHQKSVSVNVWREFKVKELLDGTETWMQMMLCHCWKGKYWTVA